MVPSSEFSEMALNAMDDPSPSNSRSIVKAIIKYSDDGKLREKVVQLLDAHPSDDIWDYVLLGYKRQETKFQEELVVKWLNLNKSNSKLFPLPYATITTKSPKILESVFEWLLDGGRESEYQASVIASLLESTSLSCPEILPIVLRRAREWLKENPIDEKRERVLSGLVLASQAPEDIDLAKSSISSKELHGGDKVVASLLQHSPDEESINLAILSMEQWHTSSFLEPHILCAFLHTDPENEKGVEYARKWIDSNPKHEYRKTVEKLIER